MPPVTAHMSIELPAERRDPSCLGLEFQGGRLRLQSFAPPAALAAGELPNWECTRRRSWIVDRVNGMRVNSESDLTMFLQSIAHVHSITFRSSHFQEYGLTRDTQEQADEDVHWLLARCVPQRDVQSEFVQAGKLLARLHTHRLRGKQRIYSRSIMPAPLHVSHELRELVSNHIRQGKQAQVLYSHRFSPEADSSRTNLDYRPSSTVTKCDLYQDWMRVRVPELQSLGRNWAKAVEMSRAEHKDGSSVVAFTLPISKRPNLFNDIPSFSDTLGIVLNDELQVLQVGDEGHPVQRFGLHRHHYVYSMRRGETCEFLRSSAELVESLQRFQSIEGDELLMYLYTVLHFYWCIFDSLAPSVQSSPVQSSLSQIGV